MKGIALITLLIAFASGEIISTGALYSYLGLLNLLAIYIVTTGIGAVILTSQLKSFRAVSKALNVDDDYEEVSSNLKAQLEGAEASDSTKRWTFLVYQATIYSVSWGFVLIPGLLTDLAGYGMIGLWFVRKDRVAELL